MKDLLSMIDSQKSSNDYELITSNIAYGRLTGAVCGALLALVIVAVSPGTADSAIQIFAALTFIGRYVGKLLAVNQLRKTSIVEGDHLSALVRILKEVVPEENISEAAAAILKRNPHPVLLLDPVWISNNIPARLLASSKEKNQSLVIEK